jgi:hypothetical protein
MERAKLTVGKHILEPPHKNAVPTESHSDGQHWLLPKDFVDRAPGTGV